MREHVRDDNGEYVTMQTIDPENTEYTNRIRVLRTLIDTHADRYVQAGTRALTQGKPLTAKQDFYRALALDPDREDAQKYLRKLEKQHVEAVQLANIKRIEKVLKSESEQDQEPDKEEKKQTSRQENFYLELGKNLLAKEDWEGAIREIKKYLAVNSNDRDISLN